jgi:hypothetical protein
VVVEEHHQVHPGRVARQHEARDVGLPQLGRPRALEAADPVGSSLALLLGPAGSMPSRFKVDATPPALTLMPKKRFR